jgi:hypothetical protein
MIKYIFLTLILIFFSACVNKRGISLKYYNDCSEYYDLQGYYHKDCDDGGMTTYKEMKKVFETPKEEPKGNVW